jgi:hypothetical protein
MHKLHFISLENDKMFLLLNASTCPEAALRECFRHPFAQTYYPVRVVLTLDISLNECMDILMQFWDMFGAENTQCNWLRKANR